MNRFKKISILFLIFLLLAACFMLVACDGGDEDEIDVTYYMEEGEPPSVTSIDIGESFTLWEIPTRNHYKFLGLYDEQGVMIVDSDGQSTVILNADITLYAKWQPNTYTISFDADGGHFVGQTVESVTADYGAKLSPFPVVEKSGYNFDGWYSDSIQVTDGAAFVSGAEEFLSTYYAISNYEVKLIAKYSVKKLEVVFEYNDGENAQQVIEVAYGEKIPEDSFPTIDTGSRKIVGWTAFPNGSLKFDREVTQSITLYPMWKNYKLIEFYISSDDSEPDKIVQVFEDDSLTPYIPEKRGYEFDGWYSSPLFNIFPETSIHYFLTSTKLYAKWNLAVYELKFVTGTNDVINSITYTMQDEIELPTYEKEYFTFLGWCVNEDFSDTPITKISKGTCEITTLYAKFKGDDKTVVLEAGDGKVSPTQKTVEYYKNYVLPVPTYDGYEFQGWFAGEGDDAVQLTDKKGESLAIWSTLDESTTLYAKYKQKYYVTITPTLEEAGTFKVNDYYVAGEQVTLEASVKTGYSMLGWYRGDTLLSSSLTYEFVMGEENIDIELCFKALEFKATFDVGDGLCKVDSVTVSYGEKYELPVAYRKGYLFKGWKYEDNLITDDEGVGLAVWKYTNDIVLVAEYEEDESGATMILDAEGLLAIKDDPKGYFVIIEDIDLSGYEWVPFEFSGTLLGNDCKIKNLNLEADSGNLGMFTKISGTVKDIKFENISITSSSYDSVFVGGLCAELAGGNVSGIEMSGAITGDYCRIGGIVGKMSDGSLKNCKNYATVKSDTYETAVSAGGIVSFVEKGEVSGCENFGDISIGYHCGGVIGVSYTNSISELKNVGTVIGKNYIGGVVGYFEKAGTYTIANLENKGAVTGEEKVGGVFGNFVNHAGWNSNDSTYNLKLLKFTNDGEVNGTKYIGGVIGYLTAYIDGSYSDGSTITTANNFENKGDVTGVFYVGGLIGYAYSDNGTSKIATSESAANITADAYVGGLAGRLEGIKLVDSSNEGSTVNAKAYWLEDSNYYAYVGGYVGYGYCVENCHNKTDIIYEDRGAYVGGIAGRLQNTIKSCTNTAAVTAEEANYVGGLVGEIVCTGTYDVVQLRNSGTVNGMSCVGGVIGNLTNHAKWNSNDSTYNLKIAKLVNSGAVDGDQQVGGIIGRLYTAITGSYSDGSVIITSNGLENTAAVNGKNYVGGLIGYAYSDNGSSQIIASKSSGAIAAEAYVGGLAGQLENVKLVASSNEGATVKASYYVINGTDYYAYFGGYVGCGYYIENCHNNAEITYTERGNYIGGIAGRLLNAIKNCSNTADVGAGNASYVGGLIGELSCAGTYDVAQLTNSGLVTGKDYVGGCIGALTNHAKWDSNDSTYNLKITKLVNSGTVNGDQQVGGVIGRLYTAITGSYSDGSVVITANGIENTASVNGIHYVGGLIGYAYSDNGSSQIASSKSSGAITAEAYIGGLAGKLENVKLVDSSNKDASVTATYYVADGQNHYAYLGGYVGWGYYIEGCVNAVEITYTEDGMFVGGIAGKLSNAIKNSQNDAAIIAENAHYVGGIAGDLHCLGTYEVASITNTGDVKGKNFVGGLFGRINDNNGGGSSNDTHYVLKLNKLNNTGDVVGDDYVGGCVGYICCLVNGSYSDGSVTISANDINNNANVTGGEGKTRVAGLFGEVSTDNGNSILTDYECNGYVNETYVSTADDTDVLQELLVAVKSNFTLRA